MRVRRNNNLLIMKNILVSWFDKGFQGQMKKEWEWHLEMQRRERQRLGITL